MEVNKNQLSVIKENNTGIVLSEENKILENIITSKNHFCYPVFDESSPKINTMQYEELFVCLKIILNNIALFMNIQEPNPPLVKMITDRISAKFGNFRLAEIESALNMSVDGDLVGEDGKTIKCYKNINGDWVLSCLQSYKKRRMEELPKIEILKNSLSRQLEEKNNTEPQSSDEVLFGFIKKMKDRLIEDGKPIESHDDYRRRKCKIYSETIDKRNKYKK